MALPEAPRFGATLARLTLGEAVAEVPLRWTEWGPVGGFPTLCVHGLTRTGRDFDELARALAADGGRVICPDIPGRGMSGWLPDGRFYAVPAYVQAMLPLVQALGGPFDWVGTSMGGLIGMPIAAIPGMPLRRLVLNDIGGFIPKAALAQIGAYVGQAVNFPDLPALEAHLRRIHAPFGPLTDAQWRHLAETSGRVTPTGRWVLHYDPAIAVPMRGVEPQDADLWALWEQVKAPTLILRGESSTLLLPETAARMAEREGARLVTVSGCGHAPALMDVSQIETVRAFLNG